MNKLSQRQAPLRRKVWTENLPWHRKSEPSQTPVLIGSPEIKNLKVASKTVFSNKPKVVKVILISTPYFEYFLS